LKLVEKRGASFFIPHPPPPFPFRVPVKIFSPRCGVSIRTELAASGGDASGLYSGVAWFETLTGHRIQLFSF